MEKELVFRNESGAAVTTSYLVAETFGKEHRNVLRDIESLECSESFHLLNFEQMFKIRELPTGGQVKDRYYNISKDGFTILAMGYTGKKAMEFKEKYITAFNKMEAQLILANQQQAQLTQQLLSACEKLETMNNRLEFIEKRVLTVDKKKKPAKPKYLTISEAISVFAAKVRCIGKEDFYHCLRELEHLSKDEEDYNRPQGQYALTDIIAKTIKSIK